MYNCICIYIYIHRYVHAKLRRTGCTTPWAAAGVTGRNFIKGKSISERANIVKRCWAQIPEEAAHRGLVGGGGGERRGGAALPTDTFLL